MKSFFLTRQLREKVLLTAFILLGAAIWASSLTDRGAAAVREFRQTGAVLAEQQLWLNRREEIEQAAAAAVAHLDSSRTFNGVRLSAEVTALANATGLGANAASDSPRTEHTPQFAVHTLQLRLNRVEWEQLDRFYRALAERAPYINIEQFAINADRNGERLNALIRVSSVELER